MYWQKTDCPKCACDEIELYGHHIDIRYSLGMFYYGSCPKCGFQSDAAPTLKGAKIAWNRAARPSWTKERIHEEVKRLQRERYSALKAEICKRRNAAYAKLTPEQKLHNKILAMKYLDKKEEQSK